MTVRELLERMDSNELSEWLAFDREYTLPDGYFVAGQVCTSVVGSIAGGKRGPADFVPYFKAGKGRQTSADHAAAMASLRPGG